MAKKKDVCRYTTKTEEFVKLLDEYNSLKGNGKYNFANEMAAVILKAHQFGNKRPIDIKFAQECNPDITDVTFKMYDSCMDLLHKVVCYWNEIEDNKDAKVITKLYGSDEARLVALNDVEELAYDVYRLLLESCEKSKTAKLLKVEPADVRKLFGKGEIYIKTRNLTDEELNSGDTIDIALTTANVTRHKFQKDLETRLGIILAKEARMSNEDRDFVLAERRLQNRRKNKINTINDFKNEIEILNGDIAKFEELKKGCSDKALVAKIDEQIAPKREAVKQKQACINGNAVDKDGKPCDNFEKQLAEIEKELAELREKHNAKSK